MSNHSVLGDSYPDLPNVECLRANLHQSHNQLPEKRADEVAHERQEGRRESPGQRSPVVPQVVAERLVLILQQELRFRCVVLVQVERLLSELAGGWQRQPEDSQNTAYHVLVKHPPLEPAAYD